MTRSLSNVLNEVGPRLRSIRESRGQTLAAVSAVTGIGVSTLSRIESGRRGPSLEVLLPITEALGTTVDELVRPRRMDPRVVFSPVSHDGVTWTPLTRQASEIRAFKQVIAPDEGTREVRLRSHEGHEWLYVISGRLRLVLSDQTFEFKAGEAAEFDTSIPHWYGNAAAKRRLEFLSLFGPQGQRVHVRSLSETSRQTQDAVSE